MRQLVGEEGAAAARLRLVLAGAEEDVLADRERSRLDRARQLAGARAGVNPDARQIASEARLEVTPDVGGQRLAAALHRRDAAFHRSRCRKAVGGLRGSLDGRGLVRLFLVLGLEHRRCWDHLPLDPAGQPLGLDGGFENGVVVDVASVALESAAQRLFLDLLFVLSRTRIGLGLEPAPLHGFLLRLLVLLARLGCGLRLNVCARHRLLLDLVILARSRVRARLDHGSGNRLLLNLFLIFRWPRIRLGLDHARRIRAFLLDLILVLFRPGRGTGL